MAAPKYICVGIGWSCGFVFGGGHVGAAAGAAVGAFVGSLLSFLLIELLIGKIGGLDPELQRPKWTALVIDRFKEAFLFSAGCFVAGITFNAIAGAGIKNVYAATTLEWVGTSLAYGVTASLLRVLRYNYNTDQETIVENLITDFGTGFCVAAPAMGIFQALGPVWAGHGAHISRASEGLACVVGLGSGVGQYLRERDVAEETVVEPIVEKQDTPPAAAEGPQRKRSISQYVPAFVLGRANQPEEQEALSRCSISYVVETEQEDEDQESEPRTLDRSRPPSLVDRTPDGSRAPSLVDRPSEGSMIHGEESDVD